MFRKSNTQRPTEEGQMNAQKADQLTHQVNKSAQFEQSKPPSYSVNSASRTEEALDITCE